MRLAPALCVLALSACGKHTEEQDRRPLHCAFDAAPIASHCAVKVVNSSVESPHCAAVELNIGIGAGPAILHTFDGHVPIGSSDVRVGKCSLYKDNWHVANEVANSPPSQAMLK